MKKTISILLAICLLIAILPVSSYAAYTADEVKLNFDYNADGKIDLNDARTVLRVSASLEAPKKGLVYDVTGNGDGITMEDVKKIVGIVTGIDTEVNDCAEFNLELFKAELNRVKTTRPGFTKTETSQCLSMRVTTQNAPVSDLNVTNMEFDKYTDKTCDYMETILAITSLGMTKEEKAEMKAQIADLRAQAKDAYNLKTATKTIDKNASHMIQFPLYLSNSACLLEVDDIKSIECYEEDGYIVRKVTMNTDTYIGDEFTTGTYVDAYKDRQEKISYGKVFNLPPFTETQGGKETSILNKVTFKDGVIISKVDKLTGYPVSIEYSYSYIADISSIPTVDKNGKKGLQMDSVTEAINTESYVINPVAVK